MNTKKNQLGICKNWKKSLPNPNRIDREERRINNKQPNFKLCDEMFIKKLKESQVTFFSLPTPQIKTKDICNFLKVKKKCCNC